MKRIASALENLGESELLELERLVKERLTQRRSFWSEKFFLECKEVFLEEILERVVRGMSFGEFRNLGRVSKLWYQSVYQVRHLNFGINNWSGSIYGHFLDKCFTKVDSIKSHAKILTDADNDGFTRIKYLQICQPGRYEKIPREMDLSKWCSLQTLTLPQENFDYKIKGLGQLTTLTNLKCDSSCFIEIAELLNLKNLTSLCITSLSVFAKPALLFPELTYLESDFIGHFTGFTGKGVLESGDCPEIESSGTDFFDEENDSFQKGAWSIGLYGDWKSGVFTGEASVQYNDSENDDEEFIIHGPMIDGKYHGLNVEEIRCDKNQIYRGGFKNGVKEGLGGVYRWEGLYWSESALIPHSVEYWSSGEKKDELLLK